MRTITVHAYKRPTCLRRLLADLCANDCARFDQLFCRLDPWRRFQSESCEDLCQGVTFIRASVRVNPRVEGVRRNPFNVLSTAFDERGSDYNVYLEEDITISPDALALAKWYHSVADSDAELCLAFFNPDTPGDPASVFRRTGGCDFRALGLAFTRAQWERYFKPRWFDDPRGWDFSIRKLIVKERLAVVTPRFTRSNHTGREGGQHCTVAQHDEWFSGINVYDGLPLDYGFED